MLNCFGKNCNNEGGYAIKAQVPAKDRGLIECNSVVIYCALNLCWTCAQQVEPKDIFDVETKEGISTVMSKNRDGVPDFNNSTLEIISSEDLHLMMAPAVSQALN